MNLKRDFAILALLAVVALAGWLFYKGVSLPRDGFLRLGQASTLSGIAIKPLSVTEDSRCPEGVECIWAGTVKVSTQVGSDTQILELGKSVVVGNSEVTLTAVGPKDNYTFIYTVKPRQASSTGCYVGGCSGQLCTDEPNAVSTCEYTAAYACYKTAKCERQGSGQCGWTPTPELNMCLDSSR